MFDRSIVRNIVFKALFQAIFFKGGGGTLLNNRKKLVNALGLSKELYLSSSDAKNT